MMRMTMMRMTMMRMTRMMMLMMSKEWALVSLVFGGHTQVKILHWSDKDDDKDEYGNDKNDVKNGGPGSGQPCHCGHRRYYFTDGAKKLSLPPLKLDQIYRCKVSPVSFQGCSIGCDYCLTDPMHPANNGSIPTNVSMGGIPFQCVIFSLTGLLMCRGVILFSGNYRKPTSCWQSRLPQILLR